MALVDDFKLVLELVGQTAGPVAVETVEDHMGHAAHATAHAAEAAAEIAAVVGASPPITNAINALIATLDLRYAPHA